MKKQNISGFYSKILSICDRKKQFPLSGHLELTYRCNLNCIHCYCKGSENQSRELTTNEWKKIIDEIHEEGCLEICFSGGEPLIREDFLELYTYAKKKGFFVTIFSNGTLFTEKIINYLKKIPPFTIEITLNGITRNVYESITQIEKSFYAVMENIRRIKEGGLDLILKSNCLKQNSKEIIKIKNWALGFLGSISKKKYRYKYDPLIYPRLNGDKEPCKYRLSAKAMLKLRKSDANMWNEYMEIVCKKSKLLRKEEYLYQCNAWLKSFFINPFGLLRFCEFIDDCSSNLLTTRFKEGFYNRFPLALKERFKSEAKCKYCKLRPMCYNCPGRAYLETGNKEAPVKYYCDFAKNRK